MTTHDIQSAGGGDSFVGGGPYDNDFPGPGPYSNTQGFPPPYSNSPAPQVQNLAAAAADPFAGYEDYFGFNQRERWYLPDGKQYIEYKKMNEGDRSKYLSATRSEVRLDRATNDARISIDQSKDRKALLLATITDWHIVRKNHGTQKLELVAFNDNRTPGGLLSQWIDAQDPALLASLEKAIRKVNPWLMNEMTTEMIDKEIADLMELREAAERREAEEKNFGSK